MTQLKNDMKRVPILLLGFIIMSFGLFLTKYAGLGMAPWGVFHDGLSKVLHIRFGLVIQLVGFIVLSISIICLRTKIGIGTILNVLLVGNLVDIFDGLIVVEPRTTVLKYIILSLGVITMTFGRSLYISARLGPGPRDGLFVGITRLTGMRAKYAKPLIEFVVLCIGIMLGGTVGVGTIILVLVSGYLVDYYFSLLHFDQTNKYQSNILVYFGV